MDLGRAKDLNEGVLQYLWTPQNDRTDEIPPFLPSVLLIVLVVIVIVMRLDHALQPLLK